MQDALLATKTFCRPPVDKSLDSSRRRPESRLLAADRSLHELRQQVVQALTALGYPTLAAVHCEVASDRVVLSGALPSYHLKQMAQVAALRVAGPGRVDNRVVVTSH